MKTLFKNGNLISFDNEKARNVDILVNNGIIEKIGNLSAEKVDKIVDLKDNIITPAFANCFYRSLNAVKNSYFDENRAFSRQEREIIKKYMKEKNILSGALYFYDFSFQTPFSLIDKLSEKEENELEEFSLNLKNKTFIKVGQTLEEMGEINAKSRKMPSEFLEDFGFLDKKAVIVGGNLFEKDELEIFSSYDTSFILLPNDDARSGRRFANINSLEKFEIPFGIGSGDYAEIDFFSFMRQLLSFNSFVMENSTLLSPKQVFEIATTKGAEILGFDAKVKEGNFANFIVLNRQNILNDDIFKGIVFELSKQDVVMTVKEGKILQENGVFVMENGENYDKITLGSKLK